MSATDMKENYARLRRTPSLSSKFIFFYSPDFTRGERWSSSSCAAKSSRRYYCGRYTNWNGAEEVEFPFSSPSRGGTIPTGKQFEAELFPELGTVFAD